MRIGAKKRPFYRVVAMDERSKRNGAYIELLGTYNPLTEPKEVKLKQDRIDHWIKQGAQPSEGFLRIIGKAPQRPARKPKKEKKEAPVAPAATLAEEKPADVVDSEETVTEKTPIAEITTETPAEVSVEETPTQETPAEEPVSEPKVIDETSPEVTNEEPEPAADEPAPSEEASEVKPE